MLLTRRVILAVSGHLLFTGSTVRSYGSSLKVANKDRELVSRRGDAVSSFATILDAGPWVALQRAADNSLNILIDTPIALGDATIRLRSNTTIRAANKNCVLSKVGVDQISKTKPAFYLEDVSNISFHGIAFEFTFKRSRELFLQMVSTSPLGLTHNINLMDCDLHGAGWHAARWCSDILMQGGSINGKGTAGNPKMGALACISTGGSFDISTGKGDPVGGVVSNINIINVQMCGVRTEAIDLNWATKNVWIDRCNIWDYGLDGSINEAIDVGGGSGENICSDIFITRNRIFNGNPSLRVSGIKIKLGTKNFLIAQNELFSEMLKDVGDGISLGDLYGSGMCANNTIRGFKNSICVGQSATDAVVTIKQNRCLGPYADGINALNANNLEIDGNAFEASVVGSVGRALHLQGCAEYVVRNNKISGNWYQQARFDSASSGSHSDNEWSGSGSIADFSAQSNGVHPAHKRGNR